MRSASVVKKLVKFGIGSLRRRDFVRPTVVEHRSGNGPRFRDSEPNFPKFRLQDALLLRPEPEPGPESAAGFFGAEISAKFGGADAEDRVDDVRRARPIDDAEFNALDRIVFDAGSDFSVDVVADVVSVTVVIVRCFDRVEVKLLQLE